MIRIAQKAQAVTNGYFGGYIGKAQPAGHMEIKKCIDKMYTLRESLAKDKKSFSQKQRAVSGRMVTDLEMNGVFRGAVEQFNLASNLKRNDVLFPECIRTFATRSLDTQTFFHRLRIALQREVSLQYTVYIPPTNQPRARSTNVKPQHVDIYGYRPLQNTPFELLSVFEFYMYFHAEALLFPDACTATKRTEWTPLGLLLCKDYLAQKQLHAQQQMPQWAPAKHYTVIGPTKDEYYTFPSEPTRTYEVFRHRWVIVRNRRPHVPVLEGSRLPGPSAAPEDSAKYCSLFFRPWSLVSDTAHVPFLANMGFSRGSRAEALQRQGKVKRRRLIGKKDGTPMNWQQAWDEYIRGNVVSKHAARLIQTFLVMTFAGSDNTPSADDDAVDDSDVEGDIPALTFSKEDARALLNRQLAGETQPSGTLLGSTMRKSSHRDQYNRAMQISSCLWSSGVVHTVSATSEPAPPEGAWPEANHSRHKLDKGKTCEKQHHPHPFRGPTAPKADLHASAGAGSIDGWLDDFKRREQAKPNAEQFAILESVARRIKYEMRQEQATEPAPRASDEEPMLDLIHGLPGTGKSKVIE